MSINSTGSPAFWEWRVRPFEDSSTINLSDSRACPHCSSQYQLVYHGDTCPRVKSIEYYPNGTIKKLEFNDQNF